MSHTINHPGAAAIVRVLQQLQTSDNLSILPYIERLFYAQDEGHSYLTLNEAEERLLLQHPWVGKIDAWQPFVIENRMFATARLRAVELAIARGLKRLASARFDLPDQILTACKMRLDTWFPSDNEAAQKRAAALSLMQKLVLINGGPGTGKTTTVAKLLALICTTHQLNHQPLPNIALAAPTGKAASHMASALQKALNTFEVPEEILPHLQALEGKTLHRLLRLSMPLQETPYSQTSPLALDILVVDEASMLDLSLLHKLLSSIKTGTRLIFLGDKEQLPPVGLGHLLEAWTVATVQSTQNAAENSAQNLTENLTKNLAATPVPPALAQRLNLLAPTLTWATCTHCSPLESHTVTLTHSYRFHAQSGIGHLAKAVIQADVCAAAHAFQTYPNALILQQLSHEKTLQALLHTQKNYWQQVQVAQTHVAHNDGTRLDAAFAALSELCVLSVLKDDAQRFNRDYVQFLHRQQVIELQGNYFAGQPILIKENNRENELYNGDIGLMLPNEHGELVAFFKLQGRYHMFHANRLPAHETAFSMTVHKSQGSEYRDIWLVPPSDAESPLFDQKLLYTALTRAKETFTFLGDFEMLKAAMLHQNARRCGLKVALETVFHTDDTRPTTRFNTTCT